MNEKSYPSAGENVDESDVVRVAPNGFGRISRNIFRAVLDNPKVELVAINDVMDFDDMAYLAKYDSVMGRLDGVKRDGDSLSIDDTSVSLYNVQSPAELPWGELDVDVAPECTGIFRTKEDASVHLEAGADKVVISAPPKDDEPVKQIAYGVNHDEYDGEDIVSNAFCMTSSVTSVAKVLDEGFGIENSLLAIVHAYMGSQNFTDSPHAKQRCGRAAAESVVPTTTGAAQAVTEILSQLDGKLDGMAIRVSVPNDSLTGLVVRLEDKPSVEEINDAFRAAADSDPLADVLGYTDDEVTSRNILGLPFSSTVDLNTINQVNNGGLYKILTWYDNGYGFSSRMLDVAYFVTHQQTPPRIARPFNATYPPLSNSSTFFRPMFRTFDDLDPGQRVLVRLDLNPPAGDGEIQDDRRFDRHAKIVRELAEAGHRVILMVHQDRSGGDDFVSLEQHADILASRIDREVGFIADTYGDDAIAAIDAFETGGVLLLENTRMCDEELPEEDPEVKTDTEFVRTFAEYVNAYVNDAYSAAHRSHASLVGFPLVLPAYAGRVMQIEYEANSSIATREFNKQVTMVVGGMKATDVIDVMDNLGDKVDQFLLGGTAGELFLCTAGNDADFDLEGMDFFDNQQEANHETIESLLDECGDQIKFAVDLTCEDEIDDRGEIAVANITERDRAYLDIGSMMVDEYDPIIHDFEAVFVKDAFGLFKGERSAVGTTGVLRAIAETDCFSVVGGGDTSHAIGMHGMDEADFGHASIAGDAHIRALTGVPLAGVETLKRD